MGGIFLFIGISAIFLVAGLAFQLIFSLVEELIISLYSKRTEKVGTLGLVSIPFEFAYWLRTPFFCTLLVLGNMYVAKHIPIDWFQVLFLCSIFLAGMFVVTEYFKVLKRGY